MPQAAFPFLPILGIVGEVAGVASQILKRISGTGTANAAGASRAYDQGLVAWEPKPDGRILLKNTAEDDLSVGFTLSRPQSDLSVAFTLPEGVSVDTRDELDDASGGLVSIAPVNVAKLTATSFTGLRKAISFAIRALAVGAVVTIVKGVRVRVDKGTFTLEFLGKPPKFAQFNAEINDKNGTTVNVTGKIENDSLTEDGKHVFQIPPGLNIQTIVNLNISLELDEEAFSQYTTTTY